MTSPVTLIAAATATTAPIAGSGPAAGYLAGNPGTSVGITTPTSNPSGTTGGGTSSTTSAAGSVGLLPILDGGYGADGRFAVLSVPMRPGDKPYPQGTIGIMIPGTKENSQESLFFPSMAATGADLIAVNAAGDPAMGSLVADLDKDNHIDLTRRAPLQSAWWVIPGDTANGESNSLAWNLGKSGQGDVYGGMVIDSPAGNGSVVQGTKVIGCVSAHLGGFMDVGGPADKHQIHVDADGRAINACHITTGALFRADDKLDGPLMFENTFAPPVKCMPIQTPVHLGFDLARGAWRWWGESVVYTVTTPPPTKEPPRKPPWITTGGGDGYPIVRPPPWDPHVIDNPNPGDPPHIRGGDAGDYLDDVNNDIDPGFTDSGTGGSTPHDGSRIIEDILDQFSTGSPSLGSTSAPDPSDLPQSYAGTALQFAAPSIIAHPVATGTDSPDISSNPNPTSGELATYNDTAPVTGDMVAFGAGSDQGKWAYTTRPGNSRWKGGTADGGFVFLAPEASLLLQDPSVRNRPTSNSLVAAGPNVSWGAGPVDLATGDISTGYRWRDSAGSLVFTTVVAGVGRDAVTMDTVTGAITVTNAQSTPSTAFHATTTAPPLVGGTMVDSPSTKWTGYGVLGAFVSVLHTTDWTASVAVTDTIGGSNFTLSKQINGGGYTPQFAVVDAAGIILYTDAGKKGFLDVGSLVTDDRVWKLPDKDGTVAMLSDIAAGGIYGGTPLVDAAPVALTVTANGHQSYTLTATTDRTIDANTGGTFGQTIAVMVQSDAVAVRTVTFGANFRANGTLATPLLASKYVSATFESDGSNWIESTSRQTGGV